jgi:hypothetical protein
VAGNILNEISKHVFGILSALGCSSLVDISELVDEFDKLSLQIDGLV